MNPETNDSNSGRRTVAEPCGRAGVAVEAAAAPAGSSRAIRTLLVDDQLLAREILARMLRSEPDIEIVGTSSDGREAVDAIHRLNPDLVFLDVEMPELDGFGVVSEVETSRMPTFIFVTANREFAVKAFDVQALDYLIKPCARERLREALRRARLHIQGRQAAQPAR